MAKCKQVKTILPNSKTNHHDFKCQSQNCTIFAPDISGGLPAPRVGLPLSVDI